MWWSSSAACISRGLERSSCKDAEDQGRSAHRQLVAVQAEEELEAVQEEDLHRAVQQRHRQELACITSTERWAPADGSRTTSVTAVTCCHATAMPGDWKCVCQNNCSLWPHKLRQKKQTVQMEFFIIPPTTEPLHFLTTSRPL